MCVSYERRERNRPALSSSPPPTCHIGHCARYVTVSNHSLACVRTRLVCKLIASRSHGEGRGARSLKILTRHLLREFLETGPFGLLFPSSVTDSGAHGRARVNSWPWGWWVRALAAGGSMDCQASSNNIPNKSSSFIAHQLGLRTGTDTHTHTNIHATCTESRCFTCRTFNCLAPAPLIIPILTDQSVGVKLVFIGIDQEQRLIF